MSSANPEQLQDQECVAPADRKGNPTSSTTGDTAIHYFGASLITGLSIFGLLAGVVGWHGFAWVAPAPIYLGVCPLALRCDPLAAVFMLLLAGIALVAALFSPGYLKHLQGKVNGKLYWLCLALFVASMAGVITAANALTFLIFWEVMSLSSGALVAIDNSSSGNARAALIYLGATRIATALLCAGFLWTHKILQTWSFSGWHLGSEATLGASILILLGLAIKAGLWPFHIWLPYAHPAAPAPVSALMSGVMIKLAIYGILRLFASEAHTSAVIVGILLVLGAVSAGWGVLFALIQKDLKRILAYSSVENIGLVALSVALFLFGRSSGMQLVAELAFSACLFHCVNHGIFKSLLFLSAGAVDSAAHTRDINQLGGLSSRMPLTTLCFLIGTAAISALVPLNGFASKWLMYQGLFQATIASKNVLCAGASLLLIGWFALVGGLSIACFTRAFGVAFLGRPRSKFARQAGECTSFMVTSQVVLVLACLGATIAGPALSDLFARISPAGLEAKLPHLPIADFGFIFVALPLIMHWLLLRGHTVRNFWTWECGYGKLTSHMQATGESLAQPIASLVRPVLQYSMKAEISGTDRRHFPERIKAEAMSQSLLEQKVYGPLIKTIQGLGAHIARLQAGSIHLYLLYLLITVVSLLSIGVIR